jgi:hypothetical protein
LEARSASWARWTGAKEKNTSIRHENNEGDFQNGNCRIKKNARVGKGRMECKEGEDEKLRETTSRGRNQSEFWGGSGPYPKKGIRRQRRQTKKETEQEGTLAWAAGDEYTRVVQLSRAWLNTFQEPRFIVHLRVSDYQHQDP